MTLPSREDGPGLEHPGVDARAFLDTSPMVPIEFDLRTGIVRWIGPQVSRLTGMDPAEWVGSAPWETLVFPDDHTHLGSARARLLEEGGTHTLEYRLEHRDGRVVWVLEIGGAARDPDGAVVFRGHLLDITDRKRQEVALWRSEEHYRALLRRAPDALVLTDDQGLVLDMNEQAEALFDYALADVAGSSIDHLLPERLRPRLPKLRAAFRRDPDRRSLVDGHSFAIERSDGTEIPVELSMSAIDDLEQGRLILCSVRDLTARRRVEAQLRSSERQLREVADVLPAMVSFVDTAGRVRLVNDACARWQDRDRGQIEGRLLREVVGEGAPEQLLSAVDGALAGEPARFRATMTDPAGRTTPMEISVVPQRSESGAVTGCFVVMLDISEELAAEEARRKHRAELAWVSRVATAGNLAASLAHQLDQPLAAVVARAREAERLLRSAPIDVIRLRAALSDIAVDGRRAGDLMASLRQLLERGKAKAEPVEVLGLLREVVDLLRGEAEARGVTVSTEGSDSALPPVLGDPPQLKQLFLNLLLNALHATEARTAGQGTIQAVVTLTGTDVEVAVRDDGEGLPDCDPEAIFEPFVTHRAGALGMGLPISRSIAEAHGGRLWAEENRPAGAVFVLRLPVP